MNQFDWLNVVILFLQTVILIGQLWLSQKINEQSLSKEKGYFVIEDTNYRTVADQQFRYKNQFHLEEETYINFELIGDSDVIVCSSALKINGIIQSCECIPRDSYFARDSRFNILAQKFAFSEKQLQENKIDIILSFELKNVSGYKYGEIITMQFEKKEGSHLWYLKKYNMTFAKNSKL